MVLYAFSVDNPVLQPNEFGENLVLPWSMEPLFGKLGQAPLICKNDELLELQISMPSLNSNKNGHILFHISGQAT